MSQVNWRAWNEDAFSEAQAANKPVLLAIHAPWCQWCRTMDEQTYGNDAISQYIGDNFIPVKVDSDRRPDVNGRYTQGGWPTTCVLTPEGDIIWGGTFLPPDGMAQLLPQVLNAFHNDKQGLGQHIAQQREQIKQRNAAPPLDTTLPVTPEITRYSILGIKHNFDFAFGGFGREQKFAHVDAIELCLEQYNRSVLNGETDKDLEIVLEKTLAGMSANGLNDAEAGGFFRYTQTPDWRDPHHEKLLEDNAQIARVFTRAYQLLGDERWKNVAAQTLRYIDTTLYDEGRGVWGGSQAADAEYYAQPVAERAEWNPPTVDSTVLTGPNALAVRAHVSWWQATGDAAALQMAKKGMDFLLANVLKADGALDHFLAEGEEEVEAAGRMPTGLLGDSADMVAALLDLYEAGQGVEYLDRAEEIAGWVKGHLEDPRSSGLFDSVVRPDGVGSMKVATKDVNDNMQMVDALLRLFLATGEEEHAHLAQRVMQAFIPAGPQLGFFGAGFALAAERALLPPILVHVVGPANDKATRALIEAAHRPYRFERMVQPLDPTDEADAEHIENLELVTGPVPTAHIHIATRKMDPITDPKALQEAVASAG